MAGFSIALLKIQTFTFASEPQQVQTYGEHYPQDREAIRLSGGLVGRGVLAAVPVDQMQLQNVNKIGMFNFIFEVCSL